MMTKHAVRWTRATGVIALASMLFSCKYEPLPLEQLACDDQHPCAAGYVCAAGVCAREGGPAPDAGGTVVPPQPCTSELLSQPCSVGVGACERSGKNICVNDLITCSATPRAAGVEVCDGVDNDCDTSVDEDLVGAACELRQGVCAGAKRTCGGTTGWGSCDYGTDYQGVETLCDGLDNDCDGEVDEVANCASLVTIAGDGPPGMRDGAAADARFGTLKSIAFDAGGNLYVADNMNHAIRRVGTDGTVTTLAGDGFCGYADGPAANARLCSPWDLEVAADGTLYFSDSGNHRVRALSNGVVTTIAGSGSGAGRAAGAALSEARFSQPSGIKLLASGDILVADRGNNLIRRIDRAQGVVVDVAGTGSAGTSEGTRSSLELSGPNDVTVDAAGTIYVSETSHRIRAIPVTGTSQTIAGSLSGQSGAATDAAGLSARFNVPTQLELDEADAALYVADSNNYRIRKVPLDPAQMTTSMVGGGAPSSGFKNGTCSIAKFSAIAGFARRGGTWYLAETLGVVRQAVNTGTFSSGECIVSDFAGGTVDDRAKDGPALSARMRRPLGLARASNGTLYWVERDDGKLRKLAGGIVTTLVGLGLGGFEDGALASAKMDNPRDLALAANGMIYIVESQNHAVRAVDLTAGTMTTLAGMQPPVATGVQKYGYADSTTDAHAVRFNQPRAITFATMEGSDYLFVSDWYNCVVRRVEVATGFTTTWAGIPAAGPNCPSYVDGAKGTARLQAPNALAADASGNVYVADIVVAGATTRIRMIKPDGSISTIHTLPLEVNGLSLQGTTLVATGDRTVYTLGTTPPFAQNVHFAAANSGWRDGDAQSAGALEITGITADSSFFYVTDEMAHRIRRIKR